MRKIFISTTSFGVYDRSCLNILSDKGFEVQLNPHGRKLAGEEIVELCRDAIGIVAGTESLDEAVLKQLTVLKVISRCGTGMDNVDLKATERLGIKVVNTPDAPTLAVAELAVGLIISLLRKVCRMDAAVRRGEWKKMMGNQLSGKTVGIIGFGRIGRKTAELLALLGCKIIFYDVAVDAAPEGFEMVSLQELLGRSDIVTFHVSSKSKIVGAEEIKLMKQGAWIINLSRGGVVDENALYLALKEGRLSGAALDVFEQEPYTGPFKDLDNVIITPHIGSYAKESRIAMELQSVENLLKGLEAHK
ncbi:MAG: phosphoglycerate dehydrogenase [Nitrospirae bacterium]|nr:phosphoglycerate dehydrogenase [Nitrospirota bacterium]